MIIYLTHHTWMFPNSSMQKDPHLLQLGVHKNIHPTGLVANSNIGVPKTFCTATFQEYQESLPW